MMTKFRRSTAWLLTIAMLFTMLPAITVSASEQKEAASVSTVYTETYIPEIDLLDNDELIDAYVEQLFSPWGGVSFYGTAASVRLNEVEQNVYEALKSKIADIAVNGGSTELVLDVTGMGVEYTVNAINGSTFSGVFSNVNISKIIDALMADCPYDMYWYDKTKGVSYGLKEWSGTIQIDAEVEATKLKFSFIVAGSYKEDGDDYTVISSTDEGSKLKSANAAAAAAQGIVNKYASSSDYDKLVGYKNEICTLVDYNFDAVKVEYTGDYGDPWQLVYVFDGAPDTKVVCEGYAKAFQYLCDLTTWSNNNKMYCCTVTGQMEGGTGAGRHMWNIFTMNDGEENYLVDVTNSDDLSVGQDGELFLAGGTSASLTYKVTYTDGSTGEITMPGYTVPAGGQDIGFYYDSDTLELWGESGAIGNSILKLAATNYVPTQPVQNYTVTVEDSENGTVTANTASAAKGATVTLTVSPDEGYVLSELKVTYGDNVDVTVTNNTFTMPEGDVTVKATFTKCVHSDGYNYKNENNGDTITAVCAVCNGEAGTAKITAENAVYTGSAYTGANVTYSGGWTGSLTITYTAKEGSSLTENKPVNAGSYTASITAGEGVTASADFDISSASIASAQVTVADGTYTYTGSAITPAITVTLNDKTLTANDYTVSWTDNINAGTAKVTVTGTGNYTGTAGTTFTIGNAAPVVIAAPEAVSDLTYTGNPQELITAGTATGGTMQYSMDNSTWNTEIPTGTNAGSYTVWYKVVGGDNYSDVSAASVEVTIAKADIAKAEAAVIVDQLHTGSAITPKPVVTFNGKTLAENTDYTLSYTDNTNVGMAAITIDGTGNFTGTKTVNFKIVTHSHVWSYTAASDTITATCSGTVGVCPIADKTATIKLETPAELTYDGNAKTVTVIQTPAGTFADIPAVTYGESGNIKAGTHTASLTYGGVKAEVSFTITAASINDAAVSVNGTYTYTGSAITPDITVTLNGKTLTADDYTVSCSDNTNVGTATVTVDGKGNYIGTAGTTFTIGMAAPEVTAPAAKTLTYTGNPQELITAGTATGGEMQYSLDNSTWSTEIPTGTDAGTYTVWYKVVGDESHSDSEPVSITVVIAKNGTVEAPVITPDSMKFADSVTVTITCATEGADIYYTTDGTTPTAESTKYEGAFTVSETTTVKAVAIKANMEDSDAAQVIYLKEGTLTKVVVSDVIVVSEELVSDPTLNTPAKIDAALKIEISEIEGFNSDDAKTYEAELKYLDPTTDTWMIADKNHFPTNSEGKPELLVTLPYPTVDGVQLDPEYYDFTVVHMFASSAFGKIPGTYEYPEVEETTDGLTFYVTGLSPITVGWKEVKNEDDSNNFNYNYLKQSVLMLYNQKYEITASSTEGGAITPAGVSNVKYDKNITYTITPDEGCEITAVLVDGKDVGAVSEYTFKRVKENHTIRVIFDEIKWQNPFTDVDEADWFCEDVQFVNENALMVGTNTAGTKFSPDTALTRAMIVTILWRLEGEPAVNYAMQFTDVADGEWYTEAVRWAAAEGIVNGYEDSTFRPVNDVTREQVMAILHRYASYKDLESGMIFPMIPQYDYSLWAENDILWADMVGLTSDLGVDIFDMTVSADRAEIAAYLRRFCEAFAE